MMITTLYTQIGISVYNRYWKKDNVQESITSGVNADNAGIGYMYGNLADGETNTTSMEQAQTNTNDSDIKAYLDNWYEINLMSYATYISDSVYCNDRHIESNNDSTYTQLGYGLEKTAYRWSSSSNEKQLTCTNKNDKFTVDDEVIGNGDLDYPIGIITADEASIAGGSSINKVYYLYTGNDYWTMSPFSFGGNYANVRYVYAGGRTYGEPVSYSYGVRPVINLKPNVLNSGDGSAANPFQVE